jgi:hypothetical protein
MRSRVGLGSVSNYPINRSQFLGPNCSFIVACEPSRNPLVEGNGLPELECRLHHYRRGAGLAAVTDGTTLDVCAATFAEDPETIAAIPLRPEPGSRGAGHYGSAVPMRRAALTAGLRFFPSV